MQSLSAIAIDHLFSNGARKQKGVSEIFVLTRLFSILIQELSRGSGLAYRKSDSTFCELWLAIPNTLVPD